ncbi:MAG: hypothetical protein WAN35_15955 [Terracidiphilus sp.]
MSKRAFIFHSVLSPDRLRDVLLRETDEEHWTLFSFSGFRGDHPLLLKLGVDTFRLRKRLYTRNDFARYFYARFEPEQSGTKIEARFDLQQYTKWFMRIWLSFAGLVGIKLVVTTIRYLMTPGHNMKSGVWVGLLVPPSLVLFGILLPKMGKLFGRKDEEFILQFVQEKLVAHMEEPYLKYRK